MAEVIENLQRESDAAVRTARAILGVPEAHSKLDVPRRFPDVSPEVLADLTSDPHDRGARVPRSHGARGV